MFPKLILKKNEERRIKSGHLWIFSNEIEKVVDDPDNGDMVEVYNANKEFLGTAFYNRNSLISGRILSFNREDDFKSYVKAKILKAYSLRKEFYPNTESFRLVFSESDFLPGLIIDKYNQTFVLQIYSFGMQKNIQSIVEVLKENLNAENIFSKNEEYFRRLEGLPEKDELYLGDIKTEIINDGTIEFEIDFQKGQKTGFYFDQRDNRIFIEKITKDKNVIDAFCNSGGFGLHASKAGAESVTYVDSSSFEIESAKQNFKLNLFSNKSEFVLSDVFDYFEKLSAEIKKYDVVMIDPPAFTKSKKNLRTAIKGYEKLNKLALQLVKKEGFLVTSSCSHHLNKDEFIQIISRAAIKAQKKIQLIHFSGASLDHPQLPAMSETSYLKFAVFRVE
jgi:23S rRNA (cytosine1962-C5)-methyltransferase